VAAGRQEYPGPVSSQVSTDAKCFPQKMQDVLVLFIGRIFVTLVENEYLKYQVMHYYVILYDIFDETSFNCIVFNKLNQHEKMSYILEHGDALTTNSQAYHKNKPLIHIGRSSGA
jgi:hypothetical protein